MRKLLLLTLLLISVHLSAQWTNSSCYIAGQGVINNSDQSIALRVGGGALSYFLPAEQKWTYSSLGGYILGTNDRVMGNDKQIVVYSTDYTGTFRISTDKGKNWISKNLPCLVSQGYLIGKNIIFFDASYVMYYSTDNGTYWSTLNPPSEIVAGSGMNLANIGNDLYIAVYNTSTDACIYKSVLNLTQYMDFQLVHSFPWEMTNALLGVKNVLYRSSGNAILRSADLGQTWQIIRTSGPGYSLYSDSTNLYVYNYASSVNKYSLRQQQWTENIVPGGDTLIVGMVTCDGALFADLSNGGTYYGTARYVNNQWKPVNALPVGDPGVSYTGLRAFWNQVFTGNIISQSSGQGVFSSPDQAATFTKLGGDVISNLNDAWYTGTEFLLGGIGGVAAIPANQTQLTPTIGISGRTVTSFEKFQNILYAGTDNGIYTSTNNGLNWTYKYLLGKYVYKLKNRKDTLFAGTDQGLLYTTNGSSWGVTSCPSVPITDIVSTNKELYVIYPAGILRRVDSLQTELWLPIGSAIVGTDVNTITNNGERLFAGTNHGSVLYTDDHGKIWTDISDPAWSMVEKLDISGTTLFAAESSSGVWKTFVGGPIGIENESRQFSVKTYPNPVTDNLVVEFPDLVTGKVKAELLDVTDRHLSTIEKELSSSGKMTVDMSSMKSGMYFLRLIYDGSATTLSVVKQ